MLNACWVPIIYFFFPETKGLELEDVDRLFARDNETRDGLGRRDGSDGASADKFEGKMVEGEGEKV